MKWFPASVPFKVVISLSCLLCIAAVLAHFLAEPTAPPFLPLQQPFSRPLPLRDRLEQWIPMALLAATADALLGRRTPVNVFAHIVALPTSPDERPVYLSTLGRPTFFTTNGLEVWLLSGDKLGELRHNLRGTFGVDFINEPRISTADGVEASLFGGRSVSLNGSTNEIGLRAALPAGSQGFYRSLYIHFVLGAHHESKRLTLRGKNRQLLVNPNKPGYCREAADPQGEWPFPTESANRWRGRQALRCPHRTSVADLWM